MFSRSPGQSWKEVHALPFSLEVELEELLAESPELLPGHPTNLALVRQLHIPEINGYLDLCGVAPDGSIYLIECKLSGSPDMRRTVVGQLLAYAAGTSTLGVDDFIKVFASAAAKDGRAWTTPEARFEQLPEAERDADYSPELLRQRLADNLRAGRFHLVVAVDALPDELKLIVGYLERQMQDVTVSALELRYSRVGDLEIAVPTLHGASYDSAMAASALLPATTIAGFDQAQAELPDHVQRAYAHIRAAADAAGVKVWGLRKSTPTIGGAYMVDGREVTAWLMSARPAKPGFGIMWAWLRGVVPEERLRALYGEVRDLPGAAVWQGVEDGWNYVNYLDSVEAFRDSETASRLITALHRALGVTASGSA